tara:strand:- start:1839 stop:2768 length:930 start_codon:yes stop_codon:yes gene_type:complete
MVSSSLDDYHCHLRNKCDVTDEKFIKKFTYIYGNFNKETYRQCVVDKPNMIVYIATPSSCYGDILEHFENTTSKTTIILEKPLGRNIDEFHTLSNTIENSKNNILLMDHYVYKCMDIVKTVKKQFTKINTLNITLHYCHGVGHRVRYFNKTGLLVDIFQGHIMWLLFEILGKFTLTDVKNLIVEKKQYDKYEGEDDSIDTFFFIKCQIFGTDINISCGKKMPSNMRHIIINDNRFYIDDSNNEYARLFIDVITNNYSHLYRNFKNQTAYWIITNYINSFERLTRLTKNIDVYKPQMNHDAKPNTTLQRE